MFNLGYDNSTEFELSSDKRDSLIVGEPLNWETDDKSYERAEKGGGTLIKQNTSLEFTRDGYDYLYSLLLVFGYDSTASITKRIKDTKKKGEDWRVSYSSYLDLIAAKFKEKTVEVPFIQGGIFDKILNRYSDTYDLVSTKSADNEDISELETVTEIVKGREIFRRSELEVEKNTIEDLTFSGGDRDTAAAIPFKVIVNSDQDLLSGITIGANQVPYGGDTYSDGNVGAVLIDYSDQPKTYKLDGNLKLRITDTNGGLLKLELIRYTFTGDEYLYIDGSREELAQMDTDISLNELTYDFSSYNGGTGILSVSDNEAVAIVAYTRIDSYTFGPRKVKYEYIDTKLSIEIDDSYPVTEAKALLPFELFDRIIEKILGEKGLLISNIFGRTELGYQENGAWHDLAVSSGFWARGFDLGEQIEDKNGDLIPKKQLNSSLEDAFSSFDAKLSLYWGVEVVNGKEYVRIEDYAYTQQDFVGIKLGRMINDKFTYIPAQNPERTPSSGDLFTAVKIGFEKGGSGYEEVNGLSSMHGIAEFNTSLRNKEANVYTKISKFRADLEAYELARKKQSRLYPDEDTNYDQDIFFRHLIKEGTGWRMRVWQDDFDNPPIGIEGASVYSPDTMGNLFLTPFQSLKRHGRIISTGLAANPYGQLTFISSNCFSDFVLNGLNERGAIENKDLGEPYTNGMILNCEGKVFQEMIDALEGYTIWNNERIPNWFGKFELMLNGELAQGRLIKSSINGNGKHEIALI